MTSIVTDPPSAARRSYVAHETGISIVINMAISAAFVWIVFGGAAAVPVSGTRGLLVDFLPQTFMIALMGSLVPSALTRKRVRGQRRRGQPGRDEIAGGAPFLPWLPRSLLVRSILIALAALPILAGPAMLLLWSVQHAPVTIWVVLVLKIAYGALVAAVVTPLAVRAVLGETGE